LHTFVLKKIKEMTATDSNSVNTPALKKGAPIGMIALSVILAGALIFLVVRYFDQKNKMREMETALTQEKDSLANELRLMIVSFDTLKTDNDSLLAGLAREKKKIIQLLSINASNIQLIKKYKGEISTMRDIMKSYIVQIDSLNTRNKILVAENTDIKQQITQVKNTNTELTKVKEDLSAKVEIASVIQAKDIVAVSLNKKRKETTKINLLDKLRICFTLRENPLAKPGPKEVFMRVLRPDSLVIATSPDNIFNFRGNKLVYSANRSADYMNQDIDMCIFLDNTGDFVVGNYSVELYLEDNIIGKTTFMLTKR
jgi:FlaG/FlaF family flagellin (archaellin)